MREQEFLRRKVDPEARQAQKERWKQIHRTAWQNISRDKETGGSVEGVVLCAQVDSGELGERDAFVDEVDDGLRGSSGEKNFGDAGLFQGGDVGFGDDAADEDGDVVHAFFVEKFH